jgi:ribose transport system substrate-binding protein
VGASRAMGVVVAVFVMVLTIVGIGASLAGAAAKPVLKTIRVGYVLPDLSNPYAASLRDGAVAEARKKGVTLLVAGSNDSATQTNTFLSYIGERST